MPAVTARCDRRGCHVTQKTEGPDPVTDLRLFGWDIGTGVRPRTLCPAHNARTKSVPRKRPLVADVSYLYVGTEKTKGAYEQRCPKCKARPNEVCVSTVDKENSWGTYPKGSVILKPHSERYRVLDKARARAANERWLGTMNERAQAATLRARERYALGAALRDFDKAEMEQLREWLRIHGGLLTGD